MIEDGDVGAGSSVGQGGQRKVCDADGGGGDVTQDCDEEEDLSEDEDDDYAESDDSGDD